MEEKCGFNVTHSVHLCASCSDNTADLIVKQGPFSLDDPKDHSVDVRISDGGRPVQTSITKLLIKVCVYFIQVSVWVFWLVRNKLLEKTAQTFVFFVQYF